MEKYYFLYSAIHTLVYLMGLSEGRVCDVQMWQYWIANVDVFNRGEKACLGANENGLIIVLIQK